MATLRGQLARIFACLAVLTLFAALSAVGARAAPSAAHVMDARTGETLYAENADTRLHPASLTKMLTLYIAFDAIRRGEISLDTMVTVSANAAAKPPSRLGLRAGQKIALRHLIRAAAVKSANDAASAIGDALSGNEAAFARRMNRTAKALGMKNSTFKNANGLTEAGHLSTARDMSILGRRLIYDFPEYYNIFARRSTDAGLAEVTNTNNRFLSGYPGADGIKTGYTQAAGFNLTASAERGGKRIIVTVFGGTSPAARNARVAALMDRGFALAPANAAVRKPAPVQIPAPDAPEPAAPDPAPALVAEAQAGRTAAKTIRLVTSLARSPRPRARPVPEADAADTAAVVLALQESIDAAVASAAAPAKEAPLPFAVVDADGQPVEPAARPAAPDAASVVETASAVAAAPTPAAGGRGAGEALPFAVVDAEGRPLGPDGTALPFAVVTAGPEVPAAPVHAPRLQPRPRPAALLAAGTAADVDAAASREETDAARLLAGTDGPAAETGAEAAAVAMLAEADRSGPAAAEPPAAAPLPQPVAYAAALPAIPAPPPLAMLRPAPPPEAAPPAPEPEVVVRMSTSGSRHWGINLGRFPARAAAERMLMRTMLAEGPVLQDGLRKIAPAAKGFDANILGLTEAQADLACRRLTARATPCRVLGP